MTSEDDCNEQLKLEQHTDDQLSVRKSADEASKRITSHPLWKRQRVQGQKICQVCGDLALGHHFGVLACGTCKVFFRRNALRPQETKKCVFQGNCCIEKKTRRFCPACRLRKCFDIGMRPELIQGEEERQARMKKATVLGQKQASAEMINTLSFQSIDVTSGLALIISPDSALWPATPSSAQQTILLENNSMVDQCPPDRIHDSFSKTTAGQCPPDRTHGIFRNSAADQCPPDRTHDSFSKSAANLEHPRFDTVQAREGPVHVQALRALRMSPSRTLLVTDPSSPAGVSSFLVKSPHATVSGFSCHATSFPPDVNNHHADEVAGKMAQRLSPSPVPLILPASTSLQLPPHADFQHVACDQIPSDPLIFWQLTEEERFLLAYLSSIYQDTVMSIMQMNLPKESMPLHMLTKEVYLEECDAQTRNVIHFAKKLQDFQQLSTDDQIAVLKASNSQVLSIRACALYISEKEAWVYKYGYLTLRHGDQLFPDNPFKDHTVQFCRIMKNIVKNDITLYALLHCVVLFDPSDERIIDRQLVNIIRGKFVILLRHYLESIYSYSHSDRYLLVLQELLLYLRDLSLECHNLMKIVFPNVSNKLLVELYDLDQ